MSIFEIVKAAVTPKQAAQTYGLRIQRTGFMTLRNVRTYRKNGEIEIRFELVRMYVAFFHYSHCNRNGRKCEKG